MFQRRIMGLVSYYIGATPDLYASKSTKYIDVPMSAIIKKIFINILKRLKGNWQFKELSRKGIDKYIKYIQDKHVILYFLQYHKQ